MTRLSVLATFHDTEGMALAMGAIAFTMVAFTVGAPLLLRFLGRDTGERPESDEDEDRSLRV